MLKTRKEELEELLSSDGMLNRKIYAAVLRIRNASSSEEVDKHSNELDEAVKAYAQHAVELDRLQRS